MKTFRVIVSGFGAVLMFFTLALFFFFGLIILWGMWSWPGLIGGVVLWPVTPMIGAGASMFTSWATFFSWLFWFALIALMINFGGEE